MAIYSEFSHEKWWFSIVTLVYQRVHWFFSRWAFWSKPPAIPPVNPAHLPQLDSSNCSPSRARHRPGPSWEAARWRADCRPRLGNRLSPLVKDLQTWRSPMGKMGKIGKMGKNKIQILEFWKNGGKRENRYIFKIQSWNWGSLAFSRYVLQMTVLWVFPSILGDPKMTENTRFMFFVFFGNVQ